MKTLLGIVAVLLLLAAGTALAQPIPDGLYFGLGDDALYQPYATSIGGSVLYSYLDVVLTTLHVALVVDPGAHSRVNDANSESVARLQSRWLFQNSGSPASPL